MSLEFGVNLNNREPLIAPDYDLGMLLALSERAEELGFDSVWVGDSLFSKPRYEPIALLSAISQRTERVSLGTACMVSSTRNPLYLALEWATLDHLSNGRTILGTGAGTKELMYRLGHSSHKAALRYQHATRQRDRAIANALDGLISGPVPQPSRSSRSGRE